MTEEETIAGGPSIGIPLKGGAVEQLTIHEIPVFGDHYRRYAAALANQDLVAELKMYTRKPDGWFKTINQATAKRIRDKGREVNRDFFTQAIEDQNPAVASVLKKLEGDLAGLESIKQELGINSSGSSAPASPPPSSSPAGAAASPSS